MYWQNITSFQTQPNNWEQFCPCEKILVLYFWPSGVLFRELYFNNYIPFSSLVAQTKISTQTALVKTINLNLLTLQRDSPPPLTSSSHVFTNPEYTEPEFFLSNLLHVLVFDIYLTPARTHTIFILKFTEPLQIYLLTCLANSALIGWFFGTEQQQLWRGSVNFKIKNSRPLFTIILSQKCKFQESRF